MPVSKGPKGVAQEMRKFKQGKLHSGSKTGSIVKNPKQAIAIALNEAGMNKSGMAKGGAVKKCPMCGKSKCDCKGYAMGGRVRGCATGGLVKGEMRTKAGKMPKASPGEVIKPLKSEKFAPKGTIARGMGKATKGGHFSGTY